MLQALYCHRMCRPRLTLHRLGGLIAAMLQGTVFASLRRAERVWAVASIHGELDRLRRLHADLAPRLEPDDRVVYLGNALGLGRDVRGTIDEIMSFRRLVLSRRNALVFDVALLRGAQEEMWQKLLQLQFAVNPGEVLDWMLNQGVGATLEAYGSSADEARNAARQGTMAITRWTSKLRDEFQASGHQTWLSALKHAAVTRDGALLFVSRGLRPNLPLDAQEDAFWWGGGTFDTITEPYGGFRKIVRGFDPQHRGVLQGAFTISLDGGCGSGGPLLAGCVRRDGTLDDVLEA
jgi:serine/threonine protein phosphatase 1